MTTTDTTDSPTPWRLARMAGCYDPDSETSAGATFLREVYDAATSERDQYDSDDSDAAHEIADGAVPIYTHAVWATFVDLGAYREDPTELGYDGSDMEQAAKVCLYMIAERLAVAAMEQASETDDDDETDDDGGPA